VTTPTAEGFEHAIIEESAAEISANGHLTPPVIFPPRPGDSTEMVDMDAAPEDSDATPRPHHTSSHEPDPDPTPRPASRQET